MKPAPKEKPDKKQLLKEREKIIKSKEVVKK